MNMNELRFFYKTNPKYQFHMRLIKSMTFKVTKKCRLEDDGASKDFIFLVGCGRSGNTLLRRLMMQEMDIYIPPETYVLPEQIMHFYRNSGESWDYKVKTTISLLEYHKEFDTFNVLTLRDFVEEACRWPEKEQSLFNLINKLYFWLSVNDGVESRFVGDKTPLNTLSLGVIRKAFPRARYICMKRDPIDVVSSYINSGLCGDVSRAAERWKASYCAWNNFKTDNPNLRFIEVDYEKLVSAPENTILEISGRIGVPLREKRVKDILDIMGDVCLRKHHASVYDAPNRKSIGKGKRFLTDREIDIINSVINA
ncbi:sulfotransferase family protein [Oceanimonas baumannii]|uniref:sulfotransferase family protein n=1 Tax=Oceanimonas baumannii TaxID=129578 RepID=UPI003A93F2D9